jgi:cytochrome b561
MDEYGSVRKLLHWLVAILVVVQIGLGAGLAFAPPHDDALTARLFNTHDGLGATILALMLLRLVLRLLLGVPVLPRGTPRFAEWLAGLNHRLLYLLLIVQPVIGYLNNGANGYPWSIFGYYTVPAIIAKDAVWAEWLKTAHLGVGTALVALILLHLLGAFYHAVIRRDGVVQRMV